MSLTEIYAQRVRQEDDGVPRHQIVQLAASTSVGLGQLVVTVAGFGTAPAAANAATGKIAGVAMETVDNSAGNAGDKSVECESGTYDFLNSGSNACSQATVGLTVYASAVDTISTLSTDGPPVGKLVAFNPANAMPNRPCRVRLHVDGTA